MNNIGKAIKEKQLSQKIIALEMGVSQPTVSDWVKGKKNPSSKRASQLANLLNVSIDYLITGNESKTNNIFKNEQLEYSYEERMLIKSYNKASQYAKKVALFALENSSKNDNLVINAHEASLYPIDYYNDYPASAGLGNYLDETHKETLQLRKAPPHRACFVNRIIGDSMEPAFSNDDKVFVCPGTVHEGEVGIFIYENEAYIKKAGKKELISINPQYKNIPIKNPESLFCVGKVLGKCDDTYL